LTGQVYREAAFLLFLIKINWAALFQHYKSAVTKAKYCSSKTNSKSQRLCTKCKSRPPTKAPQTSIPIPMGLLLGHSWTTHLTGNGRISFGNESKYSVSRLLARLWLCLFSSFQFSRPTVWTSRNNGHSNAPSNICIFQFKKSARLVANAT